jgi:hypothetical protein
MIHLKSGDTDGTVLFSLSTNGTAIDLTNCDLTLRLAHGLTGTARTMPMVASGAPTGGLATWQPTDDDYTALGTGEFNAEVRIVRDGAAARIVPSLGYDRIKIWPAL